MKKQHSLDLVWAACMYLLGVVLYGYYFGRGDQIELFPDVLKKENPGLFQGDFNASWWTDHSAFSIRKMTVELLHLGHEFLYQWTLFLHVLFGVMLLVGVIHLGRALGLSKSLAFALPALSVLLFYDFMPGGNSLFSTSFTGSTAAFAIAVWSMVFAAKNKWFWCGLLMLLASLFQPLIGIQTGLMAGVILLATWKSTATTSKLAFGLFFTALLTFTFFINAQYSSEFMESFYPIFYSFRNGHHYLPEFFRPLKITLAVGLLVLGLWASRTNNSKTFWVLLLIAGGGLVYFLVLWNYDLEILAKTQWFKTMVWVPVFSMIAVLKRIPSTKNKKTFRFWMIGVAIVVTLFGAIRFQGARNIDTRRSVYEDGYVVFAQSCKEILHPNAVCLVPFSDTRFQIFSEASVYVSFKNIIHHPAFMDEWATRIQTVYGLNPKEERHGFSSASKADSFYHAPYTAERISTLLEQNISHVVSYKPILSLSDHEVFNQNGYYLYGLQKRDALDVADLSQ